MGGFGLGFLGLRVKHSLNLLGFSKNVVTMQNCLCMIMHHNVITYEELACWFWFVINMYLNHYSVLVLTKQHKVVLQKQILHQQVSHVIKHFLFHLLFYLLLSFSCILSCLLGNLCSCSKVAPILPQPIKPELFSRFFTVASWAFDFLHLTNFSSTIPLNCFNLIILNKSRCI